jgi:hypothetical protein
MKTFSDKAFLSGLGLIIESAEFSQKGVDLVNFKEEERRR